MEIHSQTEFSLKADKLGMRMVLKNNFLGNLAEYIAAAGYDLFIKLEFYVLIFIEYYYVVYY